MQNPFVSLLGVCLLASVCSAGIWDQYLDDGTPAEPVKLDERERMPLLLVEPSKHDCQVFTFRSILNEFASDGNPQTPREILRSKTVAFCKRRSEKGMTDALAKLDQELKKRVSPLIEVLVKANEGQQVKLSGQFMPEKNLQEGILSVLERRGVDLSSIKTFEEFESQYIGLADDCKEVHRSLISDASIYSLLLDQQKIETDPTIEKWTRNTIVCGRLRVDYLPYVRGAYKLLQERSRPIKEESQPAPHKSSRLFNCLRPFSKNSCLD